MNACDARNEEKVNYVGLRVCSTLSYITVIKSLQITINVQSPANQATITSQNKRSGFESLIRKMAKDKSRVWNSLATENTY